MSQPGAVEQAGASVAESTTADDIVADDYFLPDFCAARMVLAVVLISELLAVTVALARSPATDFLIELARISLFVQWLGLTSAAVLCYARKRLVSYSVAAASAIILALLLGNTALLSEAAIWIGRSMTARGTVALMFPQDHMSFLLRNEAICLIVAALLLRYFFVSYQWRLNVKAEARSRIDALQARIRPHFLFNSLNTIASLTRSDAARAEEAVEDLADLFRATLKDPDIPITLKAELELTRIYQRIEMLRLGDRLKVNWNVNALPMRARIPGLMIQPLLENAIYHGIEPLDTGGVIDISGETDGHYVEFRMSNPIAGNRGPAERSGNQLAVDNIRQRLKLAYGDEGSLEVTQNASSYQVCMKFPLRE